MWPKYFLQQNHFEQFVRDRPAIFFERIDYLLMNLIFR